MTQDTAAQVPASVETDDDGVLMNVCQFDQEFYAKVALRMNNPGVANANILPYLIVKANADTANIWTVRGSGRTDRRGTPILIGINGPGQYRVYIKEPMETFEVGARFEIPGHALASGGDSGRAVQPLLQLDVTENADCSLSGRKVHPNELGRARGNGNDQVPTDGATQNFTQSHTIRSVSRALDFGDHLITHQLWADASRTYGTNHPRVENSRFRDALRLIYGEQLAPGTGAGASAHDRILTSGDTEIEFDHNATTGGRGRLSFRENNGQPNNRMTADESLRRTHPATMEFLLEMMAELNITYVRSTGAWRPHTGSTRHRYASAIDLTHLRTTVIGADNQPHRVTVHLHRTQSPNSNPLQTQPQETAERTRMREFSHRVHAYIAGVRQNGGLGWLGGPWTPTYAQLELAGPPTPNEPTPTVPAFATDATHVHHIHISVGTDQP
jgi:hypothetical protein